MPAPQRQHRVRTEEGLCAIDGQRFFIRGVVLVALRHVSDDFGWGLWFEVTRKDFLRYVDAREAGQVPSAPLPGRIANALPGYRTLLGKSVEGRAQVAPERPRLWFAPSSRHRLAVEQRAGVDLKRHLEMLHENLPHAF